ncbi:MAG: hypothetical protein J7K15_15580 [Deltaproteobacteria bacterium]|nr:hypothetical protein [Deltaproteobacteria bacterium]
MNSESHNSGFIYNFNMGKEIPHFKRMAENIQSSAECNAVNVIYESFVVPGDQDYLMSRLLAQKGLPRGFYWAAAQAIEKYFKAFLLMNDEGVKRFRAHPIKELFKAASKLDSSIATLNILPHQNIQVNASVSKHLKTFNITDFIDDIEKYGSADNRYNTFGVEYNTGHLCAMDSLSFKLRNKIGAIGIDRSFKKLSSDLIEVFEKNNPWFQKEENQLINQIPSEEFPIQLSSSITHFEILVKNESNTAYKIALQWLRKKMKLPYRR